MDHILDSFSYKIKKCPHSAFYRIDIIEELEKILSTCERTDDGMSIGADDFCHKLEEWLMDCSNAYESSRFNCEKCKECKDD